MRLESPHSAPARYLIIEHPSISAAFTTSPALHRSLGVTGPLPTPINHCSLAEAPGTGQHRQTHIECKERPLAIHQRAAARGTQMMTKKKMVCVPEGEAWKERAAFEKETTWLVLLSGKAPTRHLRVQPQVKEERPYLS